MNKINLGICTLALAFACNGYADNVVQDVGNAVGNVGEKAVDVTTDTAITTQVKAKLALESNMFMDVSVATTNGIVYLTGTVQSQAQVDRAKEIAGSVMGVKGVDASNLVVQP